MSERTSRQSSVWKYASKFEKEINHVNNQTIKRFHYRCNFQGCNHEALFCGTRSISNHLRSHDIILNDDNSRCDSLDAPFENTSIDSNRNKIASRALLNFIISGFLPFAILDNFHFKRFLNIINYKYRLPSKDSISNTLLNTMFNEACASISKELESAESISATTDCWTSKQNFGYIGVTVHFINSDWGLTSHTLAIENIVGNHDNVTLKNKITQVFEEWKIMEKVEFISVDNGKNIIKAVRGLDVFLLRCLGHTINLIVKRILDHKSKRISNKTTSQMATSNSISGIIKIIN